jgi:hypothetical protein
MASDKPKMVKRVDRTREYDVSTHLPDGIRNVNVWSPLAREWMAAWWCNNHWETPNGHESERADFTHWREMPPAPKPAPKKGPTR